MHFGKIVEVSREVVLMWRTNADGRRSVMIHNDLDCLLFVPGYMVIYGDEVLNMSALLLFIIEINLV